MYFHGCKIWCVLRTWLWISLMDAGSSQVTDLRRHERRKRKARQKRTARKERLIEVRVREQLKAGTLPVYESPILDLLGRS
jgi:hypothetical protein